VTNITSYPITKYLFHLNLHLNYLASHRLSLWGFQGANLLKCHIAGLRLSHHERWASLRSEMDSGGNVCRDLPLESCSCRRPTSAADL